MRYYAHYGHNEFILCLGYRGDLIREYFLHYNEAMSNDFTLGEGGRRIDLHSSDLDNWKITFMDTGLNSNIGQRLLRARKYLTNEEMFLANYADALSDLPFDEQLETFRSRRSVVASFAAVLGNQSFHFVNKDENHIVTRIATMRDQQLWINGGFFIFRREIFDYLKEGEELVEAPFARLVTQRKLMAYPWAGFWHCMDTLKDKTDFDRMEANGACPWRVWQEHLTGERRFEASRDEGPPTSQPPRNGNSAAVVAG